MDPRQRGAGLPREDGPRSGEQDAELEPKADQEAVALHLKELVGTIFRYNTLFRDIL